MTPQFQTAQPTITPPPITRAGFLDGLDGLERLKAQADRDRMIVCGSYRDVTAEQPVALPHRGA